MARLFIARVNKLEAVQFGLRRRLLPRHVQVISQPSHLPELGPDDPVVLSVLRNGMPWLHGFFSHHRRIGARRFVILDNGSTDGSREFLAAQPDTILLSSDAPYRHYENTFKEYLCDRYAAGRWCVFVDVDELFAYPGMERRDLAELARFTAAQGFTGVLTQMLDLYADVPMAQVPDTTGRELPDTFAWFETHSLLRKPYIVHPSNTSPTVLPGHSGGVRRRVFGTENGLTKVSFFRNDAGLRPFREWHHTRGARLADFTLALLHFPFNREYRDKVMEAAGSGRYGWLTDDEYDAYAAIMEHNPELMLKDERSLRFEGADRLVDEGFLLASPALLQWAGLDKLPATDRTFAQVHP